MVRRTTRTSPMWRALTPLLMLAAVASCGTAADKPLSRIDLTSSAFGDSGPIPAQFTCDGANRPPPLTWSEPPPGTRSFALILDDPDAPGGTFHHWGAYDVPPSARSVDGGASIGAEALNDFGQSGYGAPCPPKGNPAHHYRFTVYALGVDPLMLR